MFIVKIDKVYLAAPSKIAIIDHEKKKTFVVTKEGLPDAGKLCFDGKSFFFLLNRLSMVAARCIILFLMCCLL